MVFQDFITKPCW